MRIVDKHKNRLLALLLVLAMGSAMTMVSACSNNIAPTSESGNQQPEGTITAASDVEKEPQGTFSAYAQAWETADFAALYQLISTEDKTNLTQDAFVERYQSITDGIEAKNVQVTAVDASAKPVITDGKAVIPFNVQMDTLAGSVAISGYTMNLVQETVNNQKVWLVDWNEKLIFPHMDATDKVRARNLTPKRGEILDRGGQALAANGSLTVIGIVPGKFNAVKDTAIPQMAQILGISEEKIRKIADAATNADWFYPLVTLSDDAGDLSAQLTAIAGVQYQKTEGRIYPGGEAFGLVIGYIGAITAEELADHPNEGYSQSDKIGKMGLEQVYEKRLRGTAGGEIYLATSDGQYKEQIAMKAPVNGENITLALDMKTQQSLYSVMKNDAGAAAAVNPKTGEILALVSTPSFNPNLLQTYVPDATQTAWNEAVKSPFTNRFKIGYAPGSVFKLVTAAIGLKSGALKPDEAVSISGLTWQLDSSWGSYQVTRVKDPGKAVNLSDAFLYSDNIYFAQQALKIGQAAFEEGAAGFGIGENLPIDYPFYPSQISNKGLTSSVLLADTGYGQGEVLVSPLHIAMFYSTLANNGDILQPILELKGSEVIPQVWKAQAVASGDVQRLSNDLIQVVENPAGSGYTKNGARTKMLGKTGTAELKKNLDDVDAEENGWFVAMNTEQPRLAVAMIIEDVKNRHGSHYVVPLVKQVMDELLP